MTLEERVVIRCGELPPESPMMRLEGLEQCGLFRDRIQIECPFEHRDAGRVPTEITRLPV
jgi:hypothetical protein